MNAEGLLLKLQTAYKLRTLSLHELSAEKSAITDELEEASTRTTCLRTQLEDMASKVSEQDAKIADLAAQLEKEKQARAVEKEAREKSIALIQANARDSRKSYNEVPDISTEDLGISNAKSPARQKKWRGKNNGDLIYFLFWHVSGVVRNVLERRIQKP
jgi:septal ring factor EnvC (AmiA/AmiB activator)